MNKKNRNDQLERFFQHNPIEDPLYLKKYVKDHPDHKMAWYLLGKEYTEKGKEAKAAYCFAQAGEIYEAFERQKMAVEKKDLDKYLLVQSTKESKPKEHPKWKWAVLAALLLFFYIPASVDIAKSNSKVTGSSNETAWAKPTVQNNPVQAAKESPVPVEEGTQIFYTNGTSGQELQKMIFPVESFSKHSLLVEGIHTPDGKWVEWFKLPKIILGVERTEANKEQSQIQYYDPGICGCQAGDSSKFIPQIENWRQEHEEAIVLSSAITAYRQKTGALPDKPEQLSKPYPDNLLPGITAAMQAMFPKVLNEQKYVPIGISADGDAKPVQEPQAEQQPSNSSQNSPAKPKMAPMSSPLQEPLKILIDTDQHRLALVSGNYVIRSYPVGLGGEKTPQGEYMISEKVRNPNGKSNGEFGSRGMTLSDSLYAIHGTNKPSSIGKDESHGCIRMLQADIEELYDMVPQQTKVLIGKGIVPDSSPGSPGDGSGNGSGSGKPSKPFKAPLQTEDSNPGKKYKWLD